MTKKDKIQALLMNYLIQNGTIDLLLPDGVKLKVGITQETKKGIVKDPQYCWVVVSKDEKFTMLDRYSMSIKFDAEGCCVIDEDDGIVEVV